MRFGRTDTAAARKELRALLAAVVYVEAFPLRKALAFLRRQTQFKGDTNDL
jgi:hypothetical protein